MEDSECWGESVCSGDELINSHANRVSWWLAAIFVVAALILVGVIMHHAANTATTGPWSTLHPSTWIAATPNALASLVGITIVLDVYTSYMLALKKGHLDRYVGQFVLGLFMRVALWIFVLHGLSYGGTIGSMFALLALAVMTAWSVMTSHSTNMLYSLIHALVFAFVIFLIVYLVTSGAKVWPSA